MRELSRLYGLLNLLSVDVAIGAVCSALFFGRLLKVNILPYGLITLGLTVWVIYCADHLFDAARVKGRASTRRHRFHQDNFWLLVKIGIAIVVVIGVLVFFIRTSVFFGGVVLMLIVGAYLILHRWLRFPKEFLIAFLYTGGILLPSVSVTPLELSQWPWVMIIEFMLIALLNLIMFSWFDFENDLSDGNDSFVTMVGEHTSRIVIWMIFAVNVALFFLTDFSSGAFIQLTMNIVLIIIFLNKKTLAQDDRYRMLGDAIFFLPLIDLILQT
jgi:4-hydroxybenzoate polyprenyltransferase